MAARNILEQGLDPGELLNINVPGVTPEACAGVAVTRMGKRVYQDHLVERLDPRGVPYYWFGGPPPSGLAEPGTDFEALVNRFVTVTPDPARPDRAATADSPPGLDVGAGGRCRAARARGGREASGARTQVAGGAGSRRSAARRAPTRPERPPSGVGPVRVRQGRSAAVRRLVAHRPGPGPRLQPTFRRSAVRCPSGSIRWTDRIEWSPAASGRRIRQCIAPTAVRACWRATFDRRVIRVAASRVLSHLAWTRTVRSGRTNERRRSGASRKRPFLARCPLRADVR